MTPIRIDMEPGSQITVVAVSGLTITGKVAEVRRDQDGYLVAVAIVDDPNRPDPIWVRGDAIVVWRHGEAIRLPIPGQVNGFEVPADLIRQLRQGG